MDAEPKYPDRISEFRVVAVRDLTTGFDSSQPNGVAILPVSKSSHMITFQLKHMSIENQEAVLTLRTSGTEPKIKYYSEMTGPWDTRQEIVSSLSNLTDFVKKELLKM